MRVIPVDDRKMTLTVVTPPRKQPNPNPVTGEITWDVDLLVLTNDGWPDLMRVGVPESGMPKNLVAMTVVEVDGLIGRPWEKPDRHGIMFACDSMRVVAATNGAGAKSAAVAA